MHSDRNSFLRLSSMRNAGKRMDLQLQEREIRTLLTLAVQGMRSGYDLHSGPQNIMSSSTWHYIHRSLVEKCLIDAKDVRFSGKRKSVLYSPTVLGLIVALSNTKMEDLDRIATNWGHLLPLILGKRDSFEVSGLKGDAFRLLLSSARLVQPTAGLKIDYASWLTHEFYNSLLLTRFFTLEWSGKNPDEELRNKWLACISSDTEIVDFIKKERLEPEIGLFKAALNARKALLNKL